MNEGIGAMTYDLYLPASRITGVPGVAVRLGRALERWGSATALRQAARPSRLVAPDVRRSAAVEHDVRVPLRLF